MTETQRQLESDALVGLLLEHPTLIKRPVFVDKEIIAVGFNPKDLLKVSL
jgi:arsenate reductase-like glutaredoxin family protein